MIMGISNPEDFPCEIVKEGKAKVFVPRLSAFRELPSYYTPSKAPVFYNPVMELNRDLAVLVARVYQKNVDREISVCEPLTGSGIRGIRLALEVGNVKVILGDINEHAFQLAKRNIAYNKLENQVAVYNNDANCLLSCRSAPGKRFDIVDVDPFGSPVPYIDSAIRALRNGGVLSLTATDLAPLCGVHRKACLRRYGGKSLRTEYCHEIALRLLIGCLAKTAARHDIGIEVLFSYSADHYIRAYAAIAYGAKKADESLINLGYVLHCFKCLHREAAKKVLSEDRCPECGAMIDFAGPLWLGSIEEKSFSESMREENMHVAFANSVRIDRLLSLAGNEAEAPALHYVVGEFGSKLHLPEPSLSAIVRNLLDRGFVVVPTHFNSRGFRTNASAFTIKTLIEEMAKAAKENFL
jgi:tRNA (guanine26-N2/guanine27-N2)-dimethyltransferase